MNNDIKMITLQEDDYDEHYTDESNCSDSDLRLVFSLIE